MEKYTVAILCALDKELFAVRALFDKRHPALPSPRGCADSNHYALGRIGYHNVVTSGLPSGEYGTNAASDVVSNLKRTFPSVEYCLLVGIGGGVPEANDVRLGDVVVSHPSGTVPGLVQYDLGKTLEVEGFIRTGVLRGQPRQLMTAITALKSDPDLPDNPLAKSLDKIAGRKPAYGHPSQQRGTEMDILYSPGYAHPSAAQTCNRCDKSQIVHRKSRSSTHPVIHYGPIASGNQVMKSAQYRDQLSKEYGIYCFDMEAAGVMNSIECLVIRGICDYADSHKNDIWHEYAVTGHQGCGKCSDRGNCLPISPFQPHLRLYRNKRY
ncbi:purine and uridine phosphorylase [Aspergillus sergii]|uniref:Purine and uridine phosphorylase n=1 Tax=Aspergillus sergii TaxID=1034303 RepID=A0A5N6WJX7_9EURO|nr:purine and uridine phosphorylase [Aspergillus sergii]